MNSDIKLTNQKNRTGKISQWKDKKIICKTNQKRKYLMINLQNQVEFNDKMGGIRVKGAGGKVEVKRRQVRQEVRDQN